MAYDHCTIELGNLKEKGFSKKEIESLTKRIEKLAEKKIRQKAANRGEALFEAAQEIGDAEIEAKKIAKRNAALNLKRKLEISDYVKRVWKDKPELGLQSVLVGTNRARQGARSSVAAAQNAKVQYYAQSFLADVEGTGFWSDFVSGEFDDDIAQALWKLGRGEKLDGHSDVAKAVAPVMEKWNEIARTDANKAGAWIGKEEGYIVKQSHDMHKIRHAQRRIGGAPTVDEKANYKAWKDKIFPLLDSRTFDEVENTEEFLKSVWDGLSSGIHLMHSGGDTGKGVPAGFFSVAKRMSHERVLHFKDGKSWAEYNRVFGSGSLRESMLFGLERQARNTALMEGLGPNPQMTLDAVYNDALQVAANSGAQAREKLANRRKAIDNWMMEIDGSVNIPANHMAAQFGANTRALQSMAKLGGAVISSFTDVLQIAGETNYQGMGLLSGYKAALDGLTSGKASNEKKQILGMLGVSLRGMAGNAVHRYSAQDDLGGVMSSMMRVFFKYNGLTPWTDSLRKGAAFAFSKNLADNVSVPAAKLNDDLKRVFSLFAIEDDMWDMMRNVDLDEADGEKFFTPEMARRVPDKEIRSYLASRGLKDSDARIKSIRAEMETKFRNYFTDRVEYAVIEPDARVRTISKLGAQPGTALGEGLRFIMQFKSFTTAMLLKPIARDIWGRGVETDNFAKAMLAAMKHGNGEMLAMAHLIVMSTVLGYVAMSAKDILKGRTPRDPAEKATWLAAAAQGGGAGIYGDFLFGDLKNRFGGGAISTLAGPVAGTTEDIVDILQRVRDGDDVAAASMNTIINNTPFANLFYTRMALDYLIIYRIKEAMNPGYLSRMERRIEKENAQTFILRPSEAVR